MNVLPAELRLSIAIIVNALLLVGSYRAAVRLTARRGFIAMMDALLLDYLVQYSAVCVLGLLHLLTPASLYGLVAVVGIGLCIYGRKFVNFSAAEVQGAPINGFSRFGVAAPMIGALFLIGYFGGLIDAIGGIATVGDDALMYHLPIPAIWLHDHRLTFFATWFSNPANSYSPLAVETFITWLMAPVGNDLLAHYVQIPGLFCLYLAAVAVMEGAGVARIIAVLIAIAAITSRPFISQSILVKDDLFVATFFLIIVAGCRADLIRDRIGPWRLGVAAGLFFATKYTALQSAPLLLLLIDAPIRAKWRWRQWAIGCGVTLLLAGPWYLRNIWITGNPLYPVPLTIHGIEIFKGLFFPQPSMEARTAGGIWRTLTGGYQGLAMHLMVILLSGALISIVLYRKRMVREPMVRICSIGSVAGLALFFGVSHAPELRYAYPSLILLFMAMGLAFAFITKTVIQVVSAVLVAGACIWSAFDQPALITGFVLAGFICVCAGLVFPTLSLPKKQIVGVVAALALAAWIYVYWNSAVSSSRTYMLLSLSHSYPELTPAWEAALSTAPADAPIAYTNLALIRPVMGFDYTHQILYIPVRPGLEQPDDLPSSDVHLSEPQFRPFIARQLQSDPDPAYWTGALLSSGAGCIIIGKPVYAPNPPELAMAEEQPAHFQKMFENQAAVVFRILR